MKRLSMTAIFAQVVLVVGLAACQSEPDTPLTARPPSASHQTNRQIQAPTGAADEGAVKAHLANAHLDVFLGQVRGILFSHANGRKSDFYINGIYVGTIDRGERLCLDLEPGVYDFSWRLRETVLGRVRSSVVTGMLQPSQDVYLALNIDRNAGALLGPIGWALDPDRGHIEGILPAQRSVVEGLRILRPSPTVLAQIHPIVGPLTNLPPSW